VTEEPCVIVRKEGGFMETHYWECKTHGPDCPKMKEWA
jgi:hypothetical protein